MVINSPWWQKHATYIVENDPCLRKEDMNYEGGCFSMKGREIIQSGRFTIIDNYVNVIIIFCIQCNWPADVMI